MLQSGMYRVRRLSRYGVAAVVLVAGLAMSTGWAQEAPSGASHGEAAAPPPAAQRGSDQGQADKGQADKGQADKGQADNGPRQVDKGQGQADRGQRQGDKGQGRPDKGTRPADRTARDPIDTRIPIQSRDSRRKAHDDGRATKPNTAHADDRQRSRSGSSTQPGVQHDTKRNAVGMPIAPPARGSKSDAAVQGSAPAAQPKATDESGTKLPGRDPINGGRQAPAVQMVPSPIKPTAVRQPGTINGATLQRPSQGPAIVGGAAKVATGTISGTSFRTKR